VATQGQARLGATRAGGVENLARPDARLAEICSQLTGAIEVAPHAVAVAGTHRDHPGFFALCQVVLAPLAHKAGMLLQIAAARINRYRGTRQVIEQQVAIGHLRKFTLIAQQQVHRKPQSRAQQCCSAAVVRLQPAAGDQGIAACSAGFCQHKFQLANFVATSGGFGEVIPFDPDSRTAQLRRELFQTVKRRGNLGQVEPGWQGNLHGHWIIL